MTLPLDTPQAPIYSGWKIGEVCCQPFAERDGFYIGAPTGEGMAGLLRRIDATELERQTVRVQAELAAYYESLP